MTFCCDHCSSGLSQLGTNKMFCAACGCTFEVTVTIKRVSGPVRDGNGRKRELPPADGGVG